MNDIIAKGLEEALRALRSGSLIGPEAPLTGAELKRVRTKLGLSQEELAQLLGVSLSTLQSWEIGRRRPGKMARVLLGRVLA